MVTVVDRGRWTCAPRRRPGPAAGHRDAGPRAGPHTDRRGRPGRAGGRPLRGRRTRSPASSASRSARTVLRRTADDTDPVERVVVANAEQLVIVTAVADPVPRAASSTAAWSRRTRAASTPLLCLTKADLGDPEPFAAPYRELDFPVVVTRRDQPPDALADLLDGRVIGARRAFRRRQVHPGQQARAGRGAGHGVVSAVGKGRHTTVAAIALPLPDGRGWVVDTPGVRSFGLAHVTPTTCPPRSTTSPRRSRTAPAAAGTSVRPPTRNVPSTCSSPRASCAPPGSPRCAASWSRSPDGAWHPAGRTSGGRRT